MIKATETPDGTVVREIDPAAERAWRFNNDGSVSFCADHKGPWVCISWSEVPRYVRDKLRESRP